MDHLGTSYDYGSVLHYSETAFAVDPSEPTIETINPPGAEIGQREVMSALDSERVQILYGCLAIVSTAAAANNFTLLIAGDADTMSAYQTFLTQLAFTISYRVKFDSFPCSRLCDRNVNSDDDVLTLLQEDSSFRGMTADQIFAPAQLKRD